MKLPKLQKPGKYVGLYVVDFGEHSGVGFNAQEVAEVAQRAESENFNDSKVYNIHRAMPDGTLELKGVRPEIFQLEMGMFFYSTDVETAERNFNELVNLAARTAPPGRAKVHLARYNEQKFAVALIYPAEYNDEFSSWLLDGDYKTAGSAEGGTEAVQRYYNDRPDILQRYQLFGQQAYTSRTGDELLAAVKLAVQR